jgi:protein arginine kinase activator
MHLCQECGKNDANVHVTQIMNNQTTVFHLCEECAKKKGIAISINETALAAVPPAATDAQKAAEKETVCPKCFLPYSEFKEKGWLGCSHCYKAFEQEIDKLLIQVHGAGVHRGKQYTRKMGRIRHKTDINYLRAELEKAISEEEFERAAKIRDEIHLLTTTTTDK